MICLTLLMINVGNNPDVVRRVQDPFFLTQIAQTFKDVSNAIVKFAPWSGAWVSESGGAYNRVAN